MCQYDNTVPQKWIIEELPLQTTLLISGMSTMIQLTEQFFQAVESITTTKSQVQSWQIVTIQLP